MTENSTKKFNPFKVSSIGLSHFSHDVFSHFVSPLLPILINNLGMNYTMAGAISIFHRFPAFFSPVYGKIVEKSDNRLVICICLLVTAGAICCITLAPNYLILCLLILIMGISASFYHIPAMNLTKEHAGDRTGMGMSFFMTGGELARGFGPLIVLATVSTFGERKIYYLYPIALLTALLIFFQFREKRDKSAASVKKKKKEEAPFFTVLGKAKTFFLFCFLIALARAFVAAVLNSFLPTYLTGMGHSLWFAGISLTVLQFAAVFGTLLSGTVSDKLGKINTLIIISIFTPVLMFLFVTFSMMDGQIVLMEIFIALVGFFSFSSAPVLMALMQDRGTENPTTTNTIYSMTDFIVNGIALTITGILSDMISMEKALMVCALFSCMALPLVMIMKFKEKKSAV